MCLIKGCICWWKESWCYQNARYNSKKIKSFRKWFTSFCRECVLRPAVPNSQKEQSSLFQPVTWRRQSNRYSKQCASVKRKMAVERWIRHDCYMRSSVFVLLNTCIYMREHTWEKNSFEILFTRSIFGSKEICCIFSNMLLSLYFIWCKIPFFHNLDLSCSNFTFL